MSRSTRLIIGTVIVLLLLGGGGIVWYKLKGGNDNSGSEDENKLPAVKIILVNGCGFEGVAKEFSDFLSDKNVDIVSMSNTMRPIYDKTIIVNKKGDQTDLQRLQRMTGIQRYTEARNETALAAFEIIIGKDYETYTQKRK